MWDKQELQWYYIRFPLPTREQQQRESDRNSSHTNRLMDFTMTRRREPINLAGVIWFSHWVTTQRKTPHRETTTHRQTENQRNNHLMGLFLSGCWVSPWRGSGHLLRTPLPRACRWEGGPWCETARCWSEWPCREQTDWGTRQSGSRRAARPSLAGSPHLLSSADGSERRCLQRGMSQGEREDGSICKSFKWQVIFRSWPKLNLQCSVCSRPACLKWTVFLACGKAGHSFLSETVKVTCSNSAAEQVKISCRTPCTEPWSCFRVFSVPLIPNETYHRPP